MSSETATQFYEAPDIYYAAAIMAQNQIFIGKGDTASIVKQLCKSKDPCPAAQDKLILLQMGMFHNQKLFADEFKVYPDKFKFKNRNVFKIWLAMVRKRHDLTGAEFAQAFPEKAECIEMWNKCIDENGKPSLDYQTFLAYVRVSRKRKQEKRLLDKSKKKKNLKI